MGNRETRSKPVRERSPAPDWLPSLLLLPLSSEGRRPFVNIELVAQVTDFKSKSILVECLLLLDSGLCFRKGDSLKEEGVTFFSAGTSNVPQGPPCLSESLETTVGLSVSQLPFAVVKHP